MFPRDLKVEQFGGYPPEAKKLAVEHLRALEQLPSSFLPSLLREVIDYDFKFPEERAAIRRELANLSDLSPAQMEEWFGPFAQITLSPRLESFDWINQPAQFVEQLSAYLWTTHQLDAFRKAALAYGNRLRVAAPPSPLPMRRLGIAILGQGVPAYDGRLFRNLRPHGTYFSQVRSENGLGQLVAAAATRAKAHPVPYGHWYVDGGQKVEHSPLLTSVSYKGLEPVLSSLQHKIQREISQAGMGPEELRSHLAQLDPAALGMAESGDAVLDRFQVKLLTEGSGTQIFSTTFAQWATREILRRAQPLTLLVRFAPRQRQRPMNELLSGSQSNAKLDFVGSLIDGDMGAYYHWINQQRLPEAEQSSFLVWYEGHGQALAIGPSFARGAETNSPASLAELLSRMAV